MHIIRGLSIFVENEHYGVFLGGNFYEPHIHIECQLQANLNCLRIHRGKASLLSLVDSLVAALQDTQISPNQK